MNRKNRIDSDDMLKKDFPEITATELKRLRTDESYKEGFLLAISLVFSELKTIVKSSRKETREHKKKQCADSFIISKK